MRTLLVALVAFLLAREAFAQGGRYVKTHELPDGRVVVVAEADLEPRSIGSYSVRLYGARNKRAVTDDFLGGVIRARNGTIEKILLADVDGDRVSELVVVIRNVGTGSYLCADAFNWEGREPVLLTSVADLPKDADVLAALHAQCRAAADPEREPAQGREP